MVIVQLPTCWRMSRRRWSTWRTWGVITCTWSSPRTCSPGAPVGSEIRWWRFISSVRAVRSEVTAKLSWSWRILSFLMTAMQNHVFLVNNGSQTCWFTNYPFNFSHLQKLGTLRILYVWVRSIRFCYYCGCRSNDNSDTILK